MPYALVAALALSQAAGANMCGTRFPNAAVAVEAVTTAKGAEFVSEHNGVATYVISRDGRGHVLWVVTRNGHPAYPSAICSGSLIETDPKTKLAHLRDLSGYLCDADTTACAAFKAENLPETLHGILKQKQP